MRLPGRISAAIEVLTDLDQRRRPVSEALRDWGLNHRFAGSGDRAAIGNLVYDVQRKRLSHSHAMQAETPRALVLSTVVRDWGEDPAALDASFADDKFAPDALTEEEMARLTASNPLADAPDHVRADVPEWLAPKLAAAFGKDWIAEARTLTERPPLDLRVNAIKSSPERVSKSLKRFSPVPGGLAPLALRIPAGARDARLPNVQADEGYQKGWFEIQDEGSQAVALLTGAEPGQSVLDLCAGAGGKTLVLAAAMDNRGQIYAHDADRNRLAPIYDRIKRAGAHNIQVRPPEPGALDDLAGRMDKVVVDAPCTGTGTWRRHPDTKWRLGEAQLDKRLEEQAQILADAARFVKPGGELVYITCSLLPEENDAQIQKLVSETGLFLPSNLAARWHEIFPASTHQPIATQHGIMLSPRSTGTDGFYMSVLTRKAD